jgi:hypothetical protein
MKACHKERMKMTFIITVQKPVTKRMNPANHRMRIVVNADDDRQARDKVLAFLNANHRADHYILGSLALTDLEVIKA